MSDTDMPELLPCPFCGSDKLHARPPTCHQSTPYDPQDRMYSIVMCMNCSAYAAGRNNDGPRDDRSTTSAIERWNTRAAPTKEQVAAMVPELVWSGPFAANGYKRGRWTADRFSVVRKGDDYWRVYLDRIDEKDAIYTTESKAKSAAQADYTRLFLAALFPEGET